VHTPFSAVIFDNDGLLLDTEEVWTRAERTLFGRRGRAFTMAHKRALIGSARDVAARTLEEQLDAPDEGQALMDELHDLVMAEALAGVDPRPGALALLETLTAAGGPIGLASNSPRAFVERTLGAAGLLDGGPFAAIVAGDEVAHPKPAPDIYIATCRMLGLDARDCAALEDSPPGVAAAAAAGMFVVGVPYFADAALPGADLIAASLDDEVVARALGVGAAAA
jgi:HAD superfamily hydrolase (TIGR01509 family)